MTRRDQVKVTHPITTAVYTQLLMTLCIAVLSVFLTTSLFGRCSENFRSGEFSNLNLIFGLGWEKNITHWFQNGCDVPQAIVSKPGFGCQLFLE